MKMEKFEIQIRPENISHFIKTVENRKRLYDFFQFLKPTCFMAIFRHWGTQHIETLNGDSTSEKWVNV